MTFTGPLTKVPVCFALDVLIFAAMLLFLGHVHVHVHVHEHVYKIRFATRATPHNLPSNDNLFRAQFLYYTVFTSAVHVPLSCIAQWAPFRFTGTWVYGDGY